MRALFWIFFWASIAFIIINAGNIYSLLLREPLTGEWVAEFVSASFNLIWSICGFYFSVNVLNRVNHRRHS